MCDCREVRVLFSGLRLKFRRSPGIELYETAFGDIWPPEYLLRHFENWCAPQVPYDRIVSSRNADLTFSLSAKTTPYVHVYHFPQGVNACNACRERPPCTPQQGGWCTHNRVLLLSKYTFEIRVFCTPCGGRVQEPLLRASVARGYQRWV